MTPDENDPVVPATEASPSPAIIAADGNPTDNSRGPEGHIVMSAVAAPVAAAPAHSLEESPGGDGVRRMETPPSAPAASNAVLAPPLTATSTVQLDHSREGGSNSSFGVEEEVEEEVFMDEPQEEEPAAAATTTRKSTKKGRRVRSGKRSQQTKSSNQGSSYWSSDDDSCIKIRDKKQPRSSSKRRRPVRQEIIEDDEGESSTDDESLLTPQQQPQRKMAPPLLMTPTTKTAVDEKPPPVAVIRTISPKPTSAKRTTSVSFKNNNNSGSSSNLNNNNNGSLHNNNNTNPMNGTPGSINMARPPASPFPHLSLEDMEIMQRLDDEYETALEEREIGYMARYTSVRQSACFSIFFMLVFLMLGTTFFMRYADWSIHDSLLFSIYTITTVGYGHQSIPKETGFQCFTVLYIFVGIAGLTIVVAQIYQCIALEAARAQHSRDKSEMARRGLDVSSRPSRDQQSSGNQSVSAQSISQASASSSVSGEITNITNMNMRNMMFMDELAFMDTLMQQYERAKHFFTYNEYGRSFSVLLPFAGLILVGAVVVGPIEGWGVVESIYFSVVSLTTVGFGDYYPRKVPSIWFCILWLPFSIGFMSMFLKNVATFYIRLSAQNINRIEKRMRRRLARAKVQFEHERKEALKRAYHGQNRETELELRQFPSASDSDEGEHSKPTPTTPTNRPTKSRQGRRRGRNSHFDAIPTTPEDSNVSSPPVTASRASLFGSPGEESGVMNRREQIIQNSLGVHHKAGSRPKGKTMDTMKNVIQAVHKSIASGDGNSPYMSMQSSVMKMPVGDSNNGPMRKPSFALRAIVQERFAEIIATDIAGFQSSIEIKDNTLSVTIDTLKATAEKWCIPRRARKAFRAVAFEALYFVGEHGLITKGADALFALTPMEFHGLFNPLLAAMGDADTMEAWLAGTEVLWEVDLRNNMDAGEIEPGDLESGSIGSQKKSTSQKLHTATHRMKTDDSASIEHVMPDNFFAQANESFS